MKFLKEKLYELKKIELKKLTIWSLIGVGTLQVNNMWNVLATKINSGKEISFFDVSWWKEEIWNYSLTPSVIGISIAGIFWMNFIQVGAMNCIWNNVKKSLVNNNDKNDEQKMLMKQLKDLAPDLVELQVKYNKLSVITNTYETTKLLENDILTINNKESETVCVKIEQINNNDYSL